MPTVSITNVKQEGKKYIVTASIDGGESSDYILFFGRNTPTQADMAAKILARSGITEPTPVDVPELVGDVVV